MPKATHLFNQHRSACQKPRFVSNNTALLVKRHILFQKKCQKPQISSMAFTFAQVNFLRYVAFG
ncbi:hypothetical protein HMPREF9069_01193 [Atopobium sp. oral taxon 810 str. F0209]|nr:hypothetical protein HMPREF9069_01193 [Atopobium sp. oral taxon 810 str. F0209]